MAYVRQKQKDTDKNGGGPTVELTGGTVALEGAGGNQVAAQKQTAIQETQQTQQRPSFVSGQERAAANIAASEKLAERILKPFEGYEKAGQEALATRAGQFTEETKGGVMRDQDLVTRGLETPLSLNEADKQRFRDIRKGTYTGPTEGPQFEGTQAEEAKITALADLMSTKEGLYQQLGNGQRKYTTGMREFDAALLQQMPDIRERVQAQRGRASTLEAGRGTAAEQALEDIASARESARQAGQDVYGRAQEVSKGREQTFERQLQERREQLTQKHEDILAAGGEYTPQQLQAMGVTPQEYRDLMQSKRASEYGLQKKIFEPGMKGFQEGDLEYVTTGYESYRPEDARFLSARDPSTVGYGDVMSQEDLNRYRVLNELAGIEGVYGDVGRIDPSQQAQNLTQYDFEAAQAARDEWMRTGAARPDWERPEVQQVSPKYDPERYKYSNFNPRGMTEEEQMDFIRRTGKTPEQMQREMQYSNIPGKLQRGR